jgi:alpha-tubulin suppressor-like RCC1 family protein
VYFPNEKERIIDIVAGFNNALALSENRNVYGWGKRMAVYPPIELNY